MGYYYRIPCDARDLNYDNFVVNGEVHTLTYTAKAQSQTADVTLTAGEHTVVVFWPMPANESEVYEGADWNSYLWCNIASMTVASGLTVSKPTVSEVEAVFAPAVKEDTVIPTNGRKMR